MQIKLKTKVLLQDLVFKVSQLSKFSTMDLRVILKLKHTKDKDKLKTLLTMVTIWLTKLTLNQMFTRTLNKRFMMTTVKELLFALLLSFLIFLILMPMKETNISKHSKLLPKKTEKVHSTTSGFLQETNLILKDNLVLVLVSQLLF
jgi:hypothetical protein